MGRDRRDAAELAAAIEDGVARGVDLVESFLALTGRGPKSSSRALAQEHRRALAADQRARAVHRARSASLRARVTGGAAVAAVGGAVGVIDGIAEISGSGGVPMPAWAWLGAGALGLLVSIRARLRLRSMGPPPPPALSIAPPPTMPRGSVGAVEVQRLTQVRVQVLNMSPSLDRLYPGAGDELRRADAEAAGPLTALAERLAVLDQLQRELPGTTAAASAARSAVTVRARLAEGCDTYDHLLAAAAQLLSAPDLSRSTSEILTPAVNAMLAYAHGLETASDL